MSDFTIEWLGQAGYTLRINGKVIVVDPYCSYTQCARGSVRLFPPAIPVNGLEADYAFATHDHIDHLDIETLRNHVHAKTLVAPPSCIKKAIDEEKLPMEAVTIVRGQTIDFGAFKVTGMFSEHTADSVGFLFEANGVKLYISGDSLYNPEGFRDLYEAKPDIMCICINGKLGNMGYFQAERVAKAAGTRVAIPNHYDMIMHNTENPDLFTNDMRAAGIWSTVLEHSYNRSREYDVEDLLKEADEFERRS